MQERIAKQFQRISYAGGAISGGSVAALLTVLVLKTEFASTAPLGKLFVLASVVGLILSSVALVLAERSSLPFWENWTAYLSAGLGAALPSAVILVHFARIVQRLMT